MPAIRRLALDAYTRLHRRSPLHQRSPFDRALGIDTSGFLPSALLFMPGEAGTQATAYLGCVPGTLRRVLRLIPAPERWALIDLGCGKGRALAVASEFPFRSLLGLELSPDLARAARANAGIIGSRHPGRTPIEVRQDDASDPAIEGPTVLVMFHAFGPALVGRVLDAMERAARAGHPVLLVYVNPVHGRLADARGTLARWLAFEVAHDPEDLPYAREPTEAVIAWQAGGAGLAAEPGADRPIRITIEGWRAELEGC